MPALLLLLFVVVVGGGGDFALLLLVVVSVFVVAPWRPIIDSNGAKILIVVYCSSLVLNLSLASTLFQIPRTMRLSFGAVAVLAFGSTCQVVSADGAFAVACGLRAPCRGSDQRPALDCAVGWGLGQGSVRDLALCTAKTMSLIEADFICDSLAAGHRER